MNRSPIATIPAPTHDEAARQQFVAGLRGYLAGRVMPANRAVYEQRVKPRIEADLGREPRTRHEVRPYMTRDPYYQFWSAMQRRSQEMMWDAVIDSAERGHDALVNRFRALLSDGRERVGSLQLDPALEIPRYHRAYDIHLMPGGYHTDFSEDDCTAGAVYESGLALYMGGAFGSENDFLGKTLLAFYQQHWPAARPARILDMGCGVGNSTVPWARAFPDAEVHAIDVGAPMLRYGHARAEALGVPLHFSQRNAEVTGFEAGSFDLVVSHIMLHETSNRALRNILAETHRLLAPGGVGLHFEIPRGETPFEQFMFEWETYNNNEMFAAFMADLDLPALAVQAGFEPGRARMGKALSSLDQKQKNYTDGDFHWPTLVLER